MNAAPAHWLLACPGFPPHIAVLALVFVGAPMMTFVGASLWRGAQFASAHWSRLLLYYGLGVAAIVPAAAGLDGALLIIVWILAGPFVAIVFVSRLARIPRFAPGLCQECGYDLRASRKRCPECGTPITSSNTGTQPCTTSNAPS